MVRNRAYHDRLGSWLQRDPLGYTATFTLYQYGGGRVLVVTDPLGLFFLCDLLKAGERVISCFCAGIDVLDAIKSLITALPGGGGFLARLVSKFPFFRLVFVGTDILSCLCQLADVAGDICECSDERPWWKKGLGLGSSVVSTLTGCAADIATAIADIPGLHLGGLHEMFRSDQLIFAFADLNAFLLSQFGPEMAGKLGTVRKCLGL